MRKNLILVVFTILIGLTIAGCSPAGLEEPEPIEVTIIPPTATSMPTRPVNTPTNTLPPQDEAPTTFPFQTITIESAGEVALLRTMEIPGYQRAKGSQCSIVFSPDGRLLVGTCGNNPVPVFDVQSGQLLYSLYDSPQHIVTCDFSPDGNVIACGGFDKEITFWDSATGEKIGILGIHEAPIWDIDFSSDGNDLLSCSLGAIDRSSGDGDIRLWQVPDKLMTWNYSGTKNFLSISYDPAGEKIAYGGMGGKIGILDASTGDLQLELSDSAKNIGDLTYSPSGDWLVAGSDDSQIYIWETSGYKLTARLSGHSRYVNGVAINPDETILVSGSHDKTVGIWNFIEHSLVSRLEGHQDMVLRVAINPAGTLIASISWDGTVRLWGVASE